MNIIHGLYLSRLPIIMVGIFTYFYLMDERYGDVFLMYAIFAMMTYFIERDNLRLSCVVPIILYAVSFKPWQMDGRLCSMVCWVGRLSFEFFLAHCLVLSLCPQDNVPLTWLMVTCLTVAVAYALNVANKLMTKHLLALFHCQR